MWTPKRIVLLAVGFLAFTLVYLVYSMTTLGRINTLPPLPEHYKPGSDEPSSDAIVHNTTKVSPLETKLEQAFGRECVEKKWPVLLELNSKSMVMAAMDFKVEEDGRVKLEPMSVALFGKKKNGDRDIEINTLRCNQAYITFDRKVTSLSPSELNGRKVVEAELYGTSRCPIKIENNRRTALRDDDLIVTITTGPLHYYEKKQLIRTNDLVHLQDGCPPPKADIVAKGMEMELATSAPPPKPGAPIPNKAKTESISGVKRIVLKQDVTMHLRVASGAPFPGGKDRAAPPVPSKDTPAAKPAAEPTLVMIRTPGCFQYDLFKDHDLARFDVPDDADQANSPQDVTVERVTNEQEGSDQLVCKHLELRLKRRSGEETSAGGSAPAMASPEQGLEIETVHATGPYVTLTSDAEKLDAHGNDFFHDTAKKLTILKGAPFMEANKEDSLIQAPELRIQDVPLPVPAGSPPKTYQQVHASGPGEIHMLDKASKKSTTHAYWKDKLISTRDGELDLLILTGKARFEDDKDEKNKQSLQAETLKVWLFADDKKQEATTKKPETTAKKQDETAKKPDGPTQSRRPHHIEALRNVVSRSPQINVHDTSRLLIRFTDVPFERMPPEKPAAAKAAAKTDAQPRQVAATASGPASSTTAVAPPNTAASPTQAKAPPPSERPVNMTARSIEAEVLRHGERVVLDHLWAEGNTLDSKGGVQVRQDPDPANKGERGIYIEGNALDMRCYPDGNVLDVSGDLAQLLMDKILILGPDVHIDQTRNQASVKGEGAMQMQSNQTLEGKPLTRTVNGKQVSRTVPLTVHWSKYMVFSGEYAEFHGGIQATQENARLACQDLQVSFDRPISLKEGAKGDQPAKVRSLVGDKDVRVEDKVLDELGQLQKYQLLVGTSINMNTVPRDDDTLPPRAKGNNEADKSNDANEMTLSGTPLLPGIVRLMQRGGSDPAAAPGQAPANRPKQAPPARSAQAREEKGKEPDDQELKLTYIRFEHLMKASSRTNTASFWGSVRVLNFPCNDEHREIDLDAMLATELPLGAMYLRCNRLKVRTYQKEERNPQNPKKDIVRTYQEMEAHDKVIVQSKEFFAQADRMTFNEEKDQVIFIGENGHQAVLEKRYIKGGKPEVFRARKIIYIRGTGQAWVDKADSIDG